MDIHIPLYKDMTAPIRRIDYPIFVRLLQELPYLVQHNFVSEEEMREFLSLLHNLTDIGWRILEDLKCLLRFAHQARKSQLQ